MAPRHSGPPSTSSPSTSPGWPAAALRRRRLYAEVRRAQPYAELPRADFDAVLDFVATGGYALRQYERYRRLEQGPDELG
ncbi:MAG: hypothetical protein R3D25_02960 [Geminicoccaceae bacterium]